MVIRIFTQPMTLHDPEMSTLKVMIPVYLGLIYVLRDEQAWSEAVVQAKARV